MAVNEIRPSERFIFDEWFVCFAISMRFILDFSVHLLHENLKNAWKFIFDCTQNDFVLNSEAFYKHLDNIIYNFKFINYI